MTEPPLQISERGADMRPRNLARGTVSGLLWTGGSTGLRSVAQMIALVILARLLTPSEFGLYAATLIVARFASSFAEMGIAPAIVQRPQLEPRHFQVGFVLSVASGVAMALLIWICAPAIANLMRLDELVPILRVVCIFFLLRGFSMVAQASAARTHRFRWLALIDLFAFATGFLLIGVVLAWYGFGVWALVAALLTQHGVRTIVLLVGEPHPKRPLLDRRAAYELLYFGGGISVGRLFNFFTKQLDKLVVSRFLGAEALGLYSLSAQFTTGPAAHIGAIIDRVLFPTLSTVQNDRELLVRAYRSALVGCTLLVLPSSLFIAIMAPEIVIVMLGEQWTEIITPLQILMVGMVMCTNFKVSDSLVQASGAVYRRALRLALFALSVLLGALVGQQWGVEGVAYGVLAAFTLGFVLMAHLTLRITGMSVSEFLASHVPGIATATVSAGTAWFLLEHLRSPDISPIVFLVVACSLALGASLLLAWLMPSIFLGRDGIDILRTIRRLAPARLSKNQVQ